MEPQEVFSLAFVVVCCDFSKPKQYISPKLQGSSLLYINLSTRLPAHCCFSLYYYMWGTHTNVFVVDANGGEGICVVVLLWYYMVSVGAFLMWRLASDTHWKRFLLIMSSFNLGWSPAILTSDDFITSHEIKDQNKMADLLSNQPFCSNILMISSERKISRWSV